MANVASSPDIPFRRSRPRRERKSGAALFGVWARLALFGSPAGALAGGLLDHSAPSDEPVPFPIALREELARRGCNLVEVYRRGPFIAELLFAIQGSFWTLSSQAPPSEHWDADSLEDWLFGDLLDEQLPRKLQSIQESLRVPPKANP